jgi:HAD superfamily hydrolase (TIGR01549 family)
MLTNNNNNGMTKPILRGVVFDVDGTLTIPNLDFADMYRRCGVEQGKDILQEVAAMSEADNDRANGIIEDMEEEGRRTLQLMPGAIELTSWLAAHNIPMALVTRNTRKTTDVLTNKLLSRQNFHPVIPRDDGCPPKPDPAALKVIANEWAAPLPNDGIIMVGDSVSNDIAFGKNAGIKTALLDTDNSRSNHEPKADFVMTDLTMLPSYIWSNYCIKSPLENKAKNLQGLPSPKPTTELTIAAAVGDFETILQLSQVESFDINAVDAYGNTALIWATENNHFDLVESLLKEFSTKLNINQLGYTDSSALNRAARRGHCKILEILAKTGADLDLPNHKLQYPLHFAAFQEHESALRLLLDHGANTHVLDRKGRTPADDTRSEIIQKMLEEKASDFLTENELHFCQN